MTAMDTTPMAKFKLTSELVEQAVAMKKQGLNDRDIAAAIGVCKQTFSTWINHPRTKLQRDLVERIKKAESDYKAVLLETIRSAALAKNTNWTAAAWLLERKYPDEYGQNRKSAEEKTDTAPRIVLGVSVGVAQGDKADEPLCADGVEVRVVDTPPKKQTPELAAKSQVLDVLDGMSLAEALRDDPEDNRESEQVW